jgi:hypothetical protein
LTRSPLGNTVLPMPTLTFKVTMEEAARIRRLARREKRTLSEFLRRRAVQGAPPPDDASGYRIERSPVTGLPVMHAPTDTPPVTPEDIKALLSDFP